MGFIRLYNNLVLPAVKINQLNLTDVDFVKTD